MQPIPPGGPATTNLGTDARGYSRVAVTAAVGGAAGWIAHDWLFGPDGIVFWSPQKILFEALGIVLALWFLARYWEPWVNGRDAARGHEVRVGTWRIRGLAAVLLVVAGTEVIQHAARAESVVAAAAAAVPLVITFCWICGARRQRPNAAALGVLGGALAATVLLLAQVALDFRDRVTPQAVGTSVADAVAFSSDTFSLFLRWSLTGLLGGAVIDRSRNGRPSVAVAAAIVAVSLAAEVSRLVLARYLGAGTGATPLGIVASSDVWRAAGWALALVWLPLADEAFGTAGRGAGRAVYGVAAADGILLAGLLLLVLGYPFRVVSDWLPVGVKAKAVALANEATAAFDGISDPVQRASARNNVARVLLLGGRSEEAANQARLAIAQAKAIGDQSLRDAVLRGAVQVLASAGMGNALNDAHAAALDIGTPSDRDHALGDIALATARAGRPSAAAEVAAKIQSPDQRSTVLAGIVRQVVSPETDPLAMTIAREIVAAARGATNPADAVQRAIALAREGRVIAAVNAARSIEDPSRRVAAMNGVAEAILARR